MSTDKIKRYDPLPYRPGIGAVDDGDYIDRDDVPVVALESAIKTLKAVKLLAFDTKFAQEAASQLGKHIAALERLLEACK